MTARKEVRVEAQTGSRRDPDQASAVRVGSPAATRTGSPPDLGAAESQVLECLEEAVNGLTIAQLEARLPQSGAGLQDTMDQLVKRRLVVRLNTVIPSYCRRRPSAGVYAE